MKIRIAELMAVVSVSAFAFVAFKHADPLFETLFFSLTLLFALGAVLLAVGKKDGDRAFWTGFAISSLSYLLFAHVPDADETTPRQNGAEITTQSLRCAFRWIHDETLDSNFSPHSGGFFSVNDDPFAIDVDQGRSVAAKDGGTSADIDIPFRTDLSLIVGGQRILVDGRSMSFFRIGHSAWALLLGWIGGHFTHAVHLWSRRVKT